MFTISAHLRQMSADLSKSRSVYKRIGTRCVLKTGEKVGTPNRSHSPKKLFSIDRDDTGIKCVYAPNVRCTNAPSHPF